MTFKSLISLFKSDEDFQFLNFLFSNSLASSISISPAKINVAFEGSVSYLWIFTISSLDILLIEFVVPAPDGFQ